jgi:hypothetical protein
MTDPIDRFTLLAHVAATLFMVGLIWFVQVVHYPLFGGVGADRFVAYESQHTSLTTLVVGPPMLIEALTGCLLLLRRPAGLPVPALGLGLALLVVIWLSTMFLQIPRHGELSLGFNAASHQFLVVSNWIRTVAWTVRGGLVLWLTAGVIR